jgi:hypothetical protein
LESHVGLAQEEEVSEMVKKRKSEKKCRRWVDLEEEVKFPFCFAGICCQKTYISQSELMLINSNESLVVEILL